MPAKHVPTEVYAEPDIQLATIWKAVKGSTKTLLVASVAIAALTFGALSMMAPRYSSESQLEFVSKRNNPFPEGNQRPGTPESTARLDQAAINTHARSLLSSDLLLKVANELKLKDRPEFNSAVGSLDMWSRILRLAGIGAPVAGETEDERVLAAIRRQIEVAALKETRFIAIRFNSADSKLAADYANLLADSYRASLISQPVEETTKVVQALTPKVEQLRKEVLDAEAAVENYRAQSDQFRSGSQNTPVTDQRMAGLQEELLRAEASRNEAEARWRTAREMQRSGSAEVLPDVQKSTLVQGLIQQRVRLERQIAESSAALLPGHPRMQQLNADVAGLRRQITAEVEKVVQSIEKDARSATIRVESVQKQIDALKTKVVGNSGNEAKLKELESLARAKSTELERLQKQLEDNRTVVNIRQVPIEAQVIARAMPSATPVFPRKTSSAILAAAATFILGLAIVITKALLSAPVSGAMSATGNRSQARRDDDEEDALLESPRSMPIRMPKSNSKNAPPASRVHIEPELEMAPAPTIVSAAEPAAATAPAKAEAPELKAYSDATAARAATITAGIQAQPAPQPKQPHTSNAMASVGLPGLADRLTSRTDIQAGIRTIVTAESHGADPMSEARRLAEMLSAAGKSVVMLAWSPSGRNFGTPSGKPGINDLIRGTASFENVISRIPKSTVHLIQAGSAAADSEELLDADALNLTLDALDEAYEQIIVVAEFDDARHLFEAIEGRFDAAVLVSMLPAPEPQADGTVMFLGFETLDIDIVHTPPTSPTRVGVPPVRMATVASGR